MIFECDCNYCKMNTYLWDIGGDMIWAEIPKNGSYNLKQFRFNYDSRFPIETQPNSNLKKINKIPINQYKRGFVILRNPLDRFKSLLSHYFINGSRLHKGVDWLNNNHISNVNSDNVVDIILDNWGNLGNIAEPHHFNSQSSFLPKEFFQIPHMIYDMSEISLLFGLEAGVNSSISSDIFVSDYNITRIKSIYRDDFELYKKYFNK